MLKKFVSVSTVLWAAASLPVSAYSGGVNLADNHALSTMQDEKCTGVVKDASGEPVIGASVTVKGSKTGTITNMDGNFILPGAKKGDVIRISYVGYDAQEITWNGSPVSVTMKDNEHSLKEVVVTALGMKREEKALGYAMTQLNGDELDKNVINPVSALQGKVAGVQIESAEGGMFGSNKILIRGASTLGSNNQPIYVVDGVILDNSTFNGDADWTGTNSDYGNELKNLNPDDFATISVLKGAAATALYGSRGLNGAVVITTKSGKGGKGVGVEVTQTIGIDVLTSTPGLQYEYGFGNPSGYVTYGKKDDNGNYYQFDNYGQFGLNDKGEPSLINYYGMYFGPRFDSSKSVEQFDGNIGPYRAYKNNYRDAYQTGFNSNTNVAVSGGNDKTTFYTSLSYRHNEGTVARNTFDRIALLAKATHKFSSKVSLEASMTFANSKPRNAAMNLGENFAQGTWGPEYNTAYYKQHYKAAHGGIASSSYGDPYGNVPGNSVWWALYENDYVQKETSVRPSLKLNVDILSWLKFIAEANYNYYYVRKEQKTADGDYANMGNSGYYGMGLSSKEQTNANANFMFNKQFGDFNVNGFLRGEYYHNFMQVMSLGTNGGLIMPNQYFITNSKNTPTYSGKLSGEKTMLSVAFQAGISWKDQIFVDVTGRNDWSSALVYSDTHGNYSYFYPSVSGSWILSNTFRSLLPSWISFLKVRGSWAQVGNDTEAYLINSAYSLNTSNVINGKAYATEIPSTMYSQDLKPERKNSWEVGLDWRFLNNRIGLDFTYYKENTKDQIMTIAVPSVSGISNKVINAGNIQNQGVEIALNTTPVQTKDWQWDLNFTYTRNRSKIIALSPDVADYITLAGDVAYGNYRIGSVAKVGAEYGMLITDSHISYDKESGLPILTYNNDRRGSYYKRDGSIAEIGSMMPDFLGSVNTTLRYKRWSLGISMDMRFGGYVASYNSRYGTAYGTTKTSLKGSPTHGGKEWTSKFDNTTYYDGIIPNGMFPTGTQIKQPDGSIYTVTSGSATKAGETYQELMAKGKIEPTHASYWNYRNNAWTSATGDWGVANSDWVKKLNYIALRDISLSYSMPADICRKIKATKINLTLAGHNLGYLLNTLPNNMNPESVRGTNTAEFRIRSFEGVTSSFTFTINVGF